MRKWTYRQFEWHRDNKVLLPSQRTAKMLFFEDGFFILTTPLILSRRQEAEESAEHSS